jgi:antitoxin PrlF
VRAALHVEEGDDLEFTVDERGHVSVRGLRLVPTDQAWFWADAWQQGEREASAQIAAGRLKTFESGAEFLDSLGS